MAKSGWIGVDLDGTLAFYNGWKGNEHIGEPVPKMVTRVKRWITAGKDVRIFTARASDLEPGLKTRIKLIQDWTEKHLGKRLPITCKKDLNMVELWDDRCVQVVPNTGIRADSKLKTKK